MSVEKFPGNSEKNNEEKNNVLHFGVRIEMTAAGVDAVRNILKQEGVFEEDLETVCSVLESGGLSSVSKDIQGLVFQAIGMVMVQQKVSFVLEEPQAEWECLRDEFFDAVKVDGIPHLRDMVWNRTYIGLQGRGVQRGAIEAVLYGLFDPNKKKKPSEKALRHMGRFLYDTVLEGNDAGRKLLVDIFRKNHGLDLQEKEREAPKNHDDTKPLSG